MKSELAVLAVQHLRTTSFLFSACSPESLLHLAIAAVWRRLARYHSKTLSHLRAQFIKCKQPARQHRYNGQRASETLPDAAFLNLGVTVLDVSLRVIKKSVLET